MLGGIILDVDSINDLGVIMDSKVSFTGHIDVTVGKALAMFILLRPFMFPLYARNLNTPVVCSGLSMTHISIELSVCIRCKILSVIYGDAEILYLSTVHVSFQFF
jgi:hypothetical protein